LELPAHLEQTPAWQAMTTTLRTTVGDSTYDVWLQGLQIKGWDGSVLVLQGNPGTETWVAERFGRVIERCARAAFGSQVKVAFAGDPATAAREALQHAVNSDPALRHEQFIPRYSFEQFIIGDGNRLAHAAALAVAEAPAQAYNPLFLHAPPGLGKTHLLHAIANYITAFSPGTTVRYTTVEAFTNGFIAALKGKALDRFKTLYRDVDVLLIDDVQFLASKTRTEEEFFHTFNALHDSGRQLVLTADRLPNQLLGIEQRLRARFEAGLVATLEPPDRATRIAILRKRAMLDNLAIQDQVVFDLIADRITDNVRALEGALIKVVANHSLTGLPIDAYLTRKVLDQIHPDSSDAPDRELTVERIQEIVADHFKLTTEQLRSQSRAQPVAWPRQLALHLARELTNESLQKIGDAFGGRSHATVINASQRVSNRISTDKDDADDLKELTARLTAISSSDSVDRRY
jgi:chromosomal replication initiator protein